MIWWFIIQAVIMFAISLALQPKVKVPKKRPLGLDDFEVPTAEEGRALTVVFGKRRMKGPNVVYYGDVKAYPIIKRVKTSMFNTKRMTVGYDYYMTVHMILGYAYGNVKQAIVGEKTVWPVLNDPTQEAADGTTVMDIQAKYCFGGYEKEGGIEGIVDICLGAPTQGQNDWLVSKLGSDVPAFRGQTGVVLRGTYVGNNGYLKPWSFLWKRTQQLTNGQDQWYLAKAEIGDDTLNCVHVIREILTEQEFGLGYNVLDIDDSNFQLAADTCFTEGFGVGFNWDAAMACEDVIGNMLEIIDAALVVDQATGKFQLMLARDDYDPNTLETFDESDIDDILEFFRPGYGEVASKITVMYTDVYYDEERPADIEDPAVMKKQGNNIVESVFDFQAICDKSLANTVANRELKQATSMLASMKLRCLKTMAHVNPYTVFKISWAKYGLTSVIVRATSVDYGEPSDEYMTIDVVEDVFGAAYNVYSDPPDTQWVSPVNDPVDATYKKIIEAPYWILDKQFSGSSLLADLDDDAAFMVASAAPPTPDALGCGILVEDYTGSGYEDDGSGAFVPSATLTYDLAQDGVGAVNIDLENVTGMDTLEVGQLALIENEFVEIEDVDITNSQVDFSRAVLDSVPEAHSAGARIWFIGAATNFIDREYTVGDTPRVKFLTFTSTGQLEEGDVSHIEAAAFGSRMIRPYRPGNVKIDGASYPSHFDADPVLTWNHRDRTHSTEISQIVDWDSATDYGPEAGVTYTLTIYDEDNSQIRQETGLSGKTYTYPEATERSDSGLGPTDPLNSSLRFVLKSVRAGYDSFYSFDYTIQRSSRGTVSATATVTGDLNVKSDMGGNASATVTTTGEMSVRGEILKGTSSVTSTTIGRIEGASTLRGSSSSVVTPSGDLTVT
jgi:hypothetical protein